MAHRCARRFRSRTYFKRIMGVLRDRNWINSKPPAGTAPGAGGTVAWQYYLTTEGRLGRMPVRRPAAGAPRRAARQAEQTVDRAAAPSAPLAPPAAVETGESRPQPRRFVAA